MARGTIQEDGFTIYEIISTHGIITPQYDSIAPWKECGGWETHSWMELTIFRTVEYGASYASHKWLHMVDVENSKSCWTKNESLSGMKIKTHCGVRNVHVLTILFSM